MKVCVWSWCAFRQRREWISGTNTNNEVELGLSHVRHTIHSTPLFNIPLAVKIQFFPMSEYKLHIQLTVQTHARTHAMAVYVQMVMIIKASTCMFWWPINRCWCFHLIHTGRGGGYSRIYGSVTGTNLVPPSPSSSPSSSSPTAPPSSWSKGVWRHENGNSSILYERMEKQSVLFIYIFIYFRHDRAPMQTICQDDQHLSCAHREEKVTLLFLCPVKSWLHHVFFFFYF